MTGSIGGGSHALGAGEIQSRAGGKDQCAAAIGILVDAGQLVGVGNGLGGCAVFHDFIHSRALQLFHELAGNLLAVGPDDFVDRGAYAVAAFLNNPLSALSQLGVGDRTVSAASRLADLVIIGDVGCDREHSAVAAQVHTHHVQRTGLNVQPIQKGGDRLLLGLDGDYGHRRDER